jgi:hypothetical protein
MDSSHEDVIRLVAELNTRYRRRDEKHGFFDDANSTVFHTAFTSFHVNDTDEEETRTPTLTGSLRDRI